MNHALHYCFRIPMLVACLAFAAISNAADGCTAPDWEPDAVYVRGDLVNYSRHEWRAKRNTEGVIPGTQKPTWADLGACEADPGDPPPPPPEAQQTLFATPQDASCPGSAKRVSA